tara:strand:+ start:507 stop:884 length:378 start_codon:yes stop_codon:yes gene_type:complete
MNSLIIDAAKDKIFLQIIVNNKHYTNEYFNNSENFDILSSIIFNFLKKNGVNLDNISHILVNQGPGKFSSIRASIVVAKAISISKNIEIYGFKSKDVIKNNYNKVINLVKNKKLTKNLIKPIYSS